jgi:hypothetical protein
VNPTLKKIKCFALPLLLLGVAGNGPVWHDRATFTARGNMTTDRIGHTTGLLPDGTVLIAGTGYPAALLVKAPNSRSHECWFPRRCCSLTGGRAKARRNLPDHAMTEQLASAYAPAIERIRNAATLAALLSRLAGPICLSGQEWDREGRKTESLTSAGTNFDRRSCPELGIS